MAQPRERDFSRIAAARGLTYGGGLVLELEAHGRPIRATLHLDSGVVIGLDLRAQSLHPLPPLAFRRETSDDVRVQRGGFSAELESGDPEFDATVYITNALASTFGWDETPQTVIPEPSYLGNPAVRAAILCLLRLGADHVTLDRCDVWCRVEATGAVDPWDPAYFDQLVEHTTGLASAPRARWETHTLRSRFWTWLFALGSLALLALLLLVQGLLRYPPTSAVWLLGAVPGLAGLTLRPWLRKALSHHPSEHPRFLALQALAVGAPALLGVGLTLVTNGALDASPPDVRRGTLVVLGEYDDEAHTRDLTITWNSGETSSMSYYRPPPDLALGWRVTRTLRRGALGVEWEAARTASPP